MRTAIAVAAAIAATSATFAVATAANQPAGPSASAAQATAVDRAILRQLKTLNREVRTLRRGVDTTNGRIGDTKRYTEGAGSYSISVQALLERICRAVAADSSRFVSC